MKHRMLISFLCIVYLHFITGCTSSELIVPAQLNPEGENIESLTMKDNTEYFFHSYGAKYVYTRGVVAGRLESGTDVKIPLKNIVNLEGENEQQLTPQQVESMPGTKITAITNESGNKFLFGASGGKYLKVDESILGITDDGQQIRIGVDSIKNLYVSRSGLSALGIVAIVAGVVVILAIIYSVVILEVFTSPLD